MTDEYLKMVLALPDEFFENITPEFGNLFWVETYQGWEDGYSRKTYAILDHVFESGNYSLILMDSTQIDERLYKWDFQYNKRDEVTYWRGWLIPSQEQLLQIYKTKKDLQYDSMALLWLANWIEDKVTEDHGFCFDYESAEAITLLWVQETCFNQAWDGKKWI